MTSNAGKVRETTPRGFSTTRWSLVASGAGLGENEQQASEALAQLCRTYWRPIFSYVCRRHFSKEDAQDLTQDFFTMILQTNWLRHADQKRGRFRSLLLASLENFLCDAADKRGAHKRGGNVQFVSWDDWMAEAPSQLDIAPSTLAAMPADQLFDLRWAATVAEQALRRLGEECETKGRLRLFDALSAYLTAERDEVSYAKIAATLGVTETVIKRQLHNLRQRYRALLRQEVARTVRDPAEIESEIRHLCAALGATPPNP
ncbi:MAG: sigma-70 family RNA polymerase sigma factor [Chthoniobacterales bacterium]